MSPTPDPTPSAIRATGYSAFLVGAGVFLSRLSGLIREQVLAALLGVGIAADAFKAALQIPGLLQNVLGEGTLSASFVPVYSQLSEDQTNDKRREADDVAGTIATLLGLITAVIVFLGILGARPITKVLLPFVGPETFDLTVKLVRIMWAGLGFLVLSAWCLGVLNAHRKFFLSYVSPVVWNASLVSIALFGWLRNWSDGDIVRGAAWGVALGGLLQFLIQLPAVLRIAPQIRPMLKTKLAGVREVGSRFVPALLGRGILQMSAFLDLFLAGLLAAGAISGLSIAQILYLMPIGIFAMSVAAADLPELSREHRNPQITAARMRIGHERVTFYVLFSAAIYITAGRPLIGALFQWRDFTSDDTFFVWLVLAAYSCGLVASAASRLFQNACFATGDVSGPARLAVLRVVLASTLGFILMLQFDRYGIADGNIDQLGSVPAFSLLPDSVRVNDAGPQRLGAVGLALGSAIAAWVEYGLLRIRVRQSLYTTRRYRDPARRLLPAGILAAAFGGILSYLLGDLKPIFLAPIVLVVSGFAYVSFAYLRGSPSASALLRSLKILRL